MKKILFIAAILISSASAFAQINRGTQGTIYDQRSGGNSPEELRNKGEQLKQLELEWARLSPQQRSARKTEFENRRQAIIYGNSYPGSVYDRDRRSEQIYDREGNSRNEAAQYKAERLKRLNQEWARLSPAQRQARKAEFQYRRQAILNGSDSYNSPYKERNYGSKNPKYKKNQKKGQGNRTDWDRERGNSQARPSNR